MNKLQEICDYIVTADEFKPTTETFCNFAVQYACMKYGCPDFAAKPMANAMCDILSQSLNWQKIDPKRASESAQKGQLCLAAQKADGHGHVALVAPKAPEFSGSLGCQVPIVANVGKTNGYMKTSKAFPVAKGMPDFYVWSPSHGY